MRLTRFLFLAIIAGAALTAVPAAEAPLFWEAEIAGALTARAQCYEQLGLRGTPDIITDRRAMDALALKLPARSEEPDPWYHFVRGAALAQSDSKAATAEFTAALAAGAVNPGTLWALFVEFRRLRYDTWATLALDNLEKYFLNSGAQAAPVVAQQLLLFAAQETQNNADARAAHYLSYARHFDRHLVLPLLHSFAASFPQAPAAWFPALTEIFAFVSHSWLLQIVLLQTFWQWLFYFLAVLFIAVCGVLAYKYLPVALHSFSERLPHALRPELRLVLALVGVSAIACFSLYAFAWSLILIMVGMVTRRDRLLLLASALCLTLAPLWYVGQTLLHTPFERPGLALFQRVADEGWNVSLQKEADAFRAQNPTDFLGPTSSALLAIKQNEYTAAQRFANMALAQQPDDPAVLLTNGNVQFYRLNLERAMAYYTQCLQRFPRYEVALFNSGQYYCNTMESIKGTDFFAQAARLNRPLVTGFITRNDLYFPHSWPPLRQLMQPDYPSGYVFTRLLFSGGHIGERADARWGINLLGLPLVWSLLLAVLLLIAVLYLDVRQHAGKRPKKISRCALCDIPICPDCRHGILCQRCFDYTRHIRSEKLRTQKEVRITLKKDRLQRLLRSVFTAVAPGSGGLLAERHTGIRSILLLILTALLYATVLIGFTLQTAYPAYGFTWLPWAGLAVLTLYNGTFLTLSLIMQRKKAQEL